MRKIIFIIVLMTNSIMSYSQQITPKSLIYKDSIPYFYVWKDNVIQTSTDKLKKTMYISINGKITDSIKTRYGFGRNISSNDKKRRDIIYRGTDYYRLLIETGKLDTILLRNENERYDVVIDNLLIGYTNKIDTIIGNFLIGYDMQTGNKKVFRNIDDYDIGGIDASINGLLLVSTIDFGESNMSLYSYNIIIDSLIKMDYSEIKNLYDNSDIYHDDISGKYIIMGELWVDTLFNIVQPTLGRNRSSNFRGFKLKTTDSYYYLTSEIDEPLRKNGSKDVWLACRFTLSFDMCLYKIYNNQILTKEEISKFDEWELHKLKNMIFAKHGYKFKSHYLQAFYNLFAFYKGRLTDVNHLLTAEDKKNLELIQQISKNK
jgi:hypothetical protein